MIEDFVFPCPHCGQHFAVESDMAGMEIKCPTCSKTLTIPTIEPCSSEEDRPLAAHDLVAPPSSDGEPLTESFTWRRLAPLFVCCLFFGWILTWFLPNRYFIGSPLIPVLLLAVPSVVLAVLSGCFFIRPASFPRGQALGALFFTAFAGIAGLLGCTGLVEASQNMQVKGPPTITAFVVILEVVRWSEQASLSADPVMKIFGYLVSVGLLTATIKLVPLLYLALRSKATDTRPDYRRFLLVGFFSGLGFGIGETLLRYAPWNGSLASNENVTRWFALVPLHGVYATIGAAFLWWLAPRIKKAAGVHNRVGLCALVIFMVAVVRGTYILLHGLPYMGAIVDGLSLVLMFGVVMIVEKQQPQTGIPTASDGGNARGLIGWVQECETRKRRFRLQYLIAGTMILASLSFSSSKDVFRTMVQQYLYQNPEGGRTSEQRHLNQQPRNQRAADTSASGDDNSRVRYDPTDPLYLRHLVAPFKGGGINAAPQQSPSQPTAVVCPQCGGTGRAATAAQANAARIAGQVSPIQAASLMHTPCSVCGGCGVITPGYGNSR